MRRVVTLGRDCAPHAEKGQWHKVADVARYGEERRSWVLLLNLHSMAAAAAARTRIFSTAAFQECWAENLNRKTQYVPECHKWRAAVWRVQRFHLKSRKCLLFAQAP